nr:hypothetical protein GCM10025699_02530 [Microbacterium flavescens]
MRPGSARCCRTRGSCCTSLPVRGGAIPDLILQADELVRVRGDVEAILARHTGKDPAQLRADTDRDRVFTSTDAVAYGLADRVLAER